MFNVILIYLKKRVMITYLKTFFSVFSIVYSLYKFIGTIKLYKKEHS